MSICDILYFKLPIGWDELGAIATSAAVIVALAANRKATKQLRSALKMQEQSKNVELLDRRVDMAEKIQLNNTVPELTLQLLFDEEILKHYQMWRTHITEKVYAENDLQNFISESSTLSLEGKDEETVFSRIREYEYQMSMYDCPQHVHDEYEKFCNTHEIRQGYGIDGEPITSNYLAIKNRLYKAVEEAKKEQETTIRLMKEFISKSIQSIDTKVIRGQEVERGGGQK